MCRVWDVIFSALSGFCNSALGVLNSRAELGLLGVNQG